jgi:hypothetical protein
MTASRLLLTMLLGLCAARPSEAQRRAPVAPEPYRLPELVVRTEVEQPGVPAQRQPKLETNSEPSMSGAVIGGLGGGMVGGAIGLAIGAGSMQKSCRGPGCIVPVVVGLMIGESLGVSVGTHVGARSPHHGNVVLTTLTSAALFAVGVAAGSSAGQGAVMMLPLTAAAQIATAWAIESASR